MTPQFLLAATVPLVLGLLALAALVRSFNGGSLGEGVFAALAALLGSIVSGLLITRKKEEADDS